MSEHAEHHWDTSKPPLFISLGVLMLALAFSFHFVYAIPMYAIITVGLGFVLVLGGVAAWVNEAVNARKGQDEIGLAGGAMAPFIIAEAFIFCGFFAAYWYTRIKTGQEWPPPGTPVMPFIEPLIMTVILVASSVTIHLGEMRLDAKDNSGFIKWLVITMVLGAAFLAMSMMEWKHLLHIGFTPDVNIFGSVFYSITGFHASHVIVGLLIFVAVLIPALKGTINHTFVFSASIYWHFVDIIWFFVVSQIYFW